MSAPLTKFLDLSAEEADPRVLLGLPEGVVERQSILNALRSRLAQVASHADGSTSEASEVRILLHAAAARMLMPLSSAAASPTAIALAPPQVATDLLDEAARQEFERGALLTLGLHGGLNHQSLHALRILALSHGLPAEQVVPEVMGMTFRARPVAAAPLQSTPAAPSATAHTPVSGRRPARRHPGRAPASAGARAISLPRPDPALIEPEMSPVEPRLAMTTEVDPGTRFIKRLVIGCGIAVCVLFVIAVGLYLMTSGKRVPRPDSPTGVATTNKGATPAQPRPAPSDDANPTEPQPPVVAVQSVDTLIRAVRDSTVQFEVAPELALSNFEQAIASLANQWCDADAGQVPAIVDASMEFLYRTSSKPDQAQRATAALTAGTALLTPRPQWTARDVRTSVFATGMLTRILRERDLPSAVVTDVRRRARPIFGDAAALDGGYSAGAVAALGMLPGLLIGHDAPSGQPRPSVEPQAWEAYVKCTQSVLPRDLPLRQSILMGALELVVAVGAEPHQNAASLAAERSLALAVGFAPGSPARARLVEWLTEPEVSTSDLHTMTAAIIDSGQNKELDITMVVSLGASDLDRAELRFRYEGAWGITAREAPREMAQKWIDRTTDELARADESGPMARLIHATRLATLHAAACRLHDGDASTIDAVLLSQDIGVRPSINREEVWGTISAKSDSGWAARYLAVGQDIPRRREILGQIVSDPTPVDAAVLVQEATRGAPAQVRADARRVLARYSDHPCVLSALLDFAYFVPPTRDNAQIIESVLSERLPPPRSPAWRVAVRRSLVRRMMEYLAADDAGFVDLAADHLRRQYDDALAAGAAPSTTSGGADHRRASQSAAALRERLSTDAKRIVIPPAGFAGVGDITLRLRQRSERSEGDIQLFAAEEAACVDLLALLTASERPGSHAMVQQVLDEWDQQRRSASHIFDQLYAAERAMCKLWMLRLGGAP